MRRGDFLELCDGSHRPAGRELARTEELGVAPLIIGRGTLGVVTTTAQGLHAGVPHTIVQISTRPPAPAPIVYMLYPSGRLRLDGITVCNHDPGYAPPPQPGDSIAFVEAGRPFDSTETLYTAPGSWILYEHEGTLAVGLGVRNDPALRTYPTLEALTRALRGEASSPVR